WAQMLGPQDKGGSTLLAAQFSLNLSTIQQLAEAGRCEQTDERDGLAERVWGLCCATERPRLDALAQRLEPKATWDDLVLPTTETALLRQVCAQVRQRARVYGEM